MNSNLDSIFKTLPRFALQVKTIFVDHKMITTLTCSGEAFLKWARRGMRTLVMLRISQKSSYACRAQNFGERNLI